MDFLGADDYISKTIWNDGTEDGSMHQKEHRICYSVGWFAICMRRVYLFKYLKENFILVDDKRTSGNLTAACTEINFLANETGFFSKEQILLEAD